MTQNFERTRGYFGDAAQVHLPDIFPPFLYREVRRHHGVLACEGSMFKSKFANALTTMMIGSLGIAAAENKVSIGYGAEAGDMDRMLAKLCARYCNQSLILTRNEASQAILSALGVPSELGTDTAWTFEPHGPEVGPQRAERSGLGRPRAGAGGLPDPSFLVAGESIDWQIYRQRHRRRLSATAITARCTFTTRGQQWTRPSRAISRAWRRAVEAFRQRHGVFVILVAMERLDARACEALAPQARPGGRSLPRTSTTCTSW